MFMNKKSYWYVALRFTWSLLIIFFYFLGNKLVIPYVDISKVFLIGGASDSIIFANAITGGNLRQLSLFSLGLSPWMSAMLIWQMIVVTKMFGCDKLPVKYQETAQMLMTAVISIIQALVIVLKATFIEGYSTPQVMVVSVLVLMAGTFLMVWLSDLNAAYGVGGSMMLIIPGMIAYLPQDVMDTLTQVPLESYWFIIIGMITVVLFLSSIIFEKAKYRIPINKVSIHNRFKKYSYYEMKLNPAGGMPVMYAMTIVAIPQYVFILLQVFYPENILFQRISAEINVGTPGWFLIYFLIIVLLGYAFAFINVNPDKVAENMMKQGEYIYGIYPGKDTRKYITGLLWRFAFVGNIYLIMMAFLPILLVIKDPRLMRLGMIPGIFLIFNGMVLQIENEVQAMIVNTKYKI